VRRAPHDDDNTGADGDTAFRSSDSDTGDHSGAHTNCRVHTNCDANRDIRTHLNSRSDADAHTDPRVHTNCDVTRDTHIHAAHAAVNAFSNTGGHAEPHPNGHAWGGGDTNRKTYTHSGTNGNTGKRSGRTGTQPRFV
jgi:hypothetical protein